jgi:hypothetical protein
MDPSLLLSYAWVLLVLVLLLHYRQLKDPLKILRLVIPMHRITTNSDP